MIKPVTNILVLVATPVFKLFEPNVSAVDPVIDKVPASTFILALLVKEIVPAKELAPDKFLMTPSAFKPVPEIVIGSAAKVTPPSTCNALPLLMVVELPDVEPKALALPLIFNIPAAVVVAVPTEIFPV